MKSIVNQIRQFICLGSTSLVIVLLFVISSCATQTSNLGKTVSKNQVLPLDTDESTAERIWQTKDMEVMYKTVQVDDTFIIEGSLSINDSVTRTFPFMKWLKFSISYLDENNKVISTKPITIHTGYRNKLAKNLKLVDVPEAPRAAVAFAFSYWGVLTGMGAQDEHPGDWEIYFNPFKNEAEEQKTAGNGLFYAD